jgi:hypothetical protein
MIINNFIRGGWQVNNTLTRRLVTTKQFDTSFAHQLRRRVFSGSSPLDIEKFTEFDKLDLYGRKYSNL